MKNQPTRISVVGLGKLGGPIAACLAAKGFEVFGVDTDAKKVEAINRLEPPVYEPLFAEKLLEAGPRLLATLDLQAAVAATQLTMIIVPTPSDESGGFSLKYLIPVLRNIGQALREKSTYHTVVITSTVMPGATESEIRQTLENFSNKTAGKEFGLCYSPEFVALGSVIHDCLNPDMVLIGESDPRAGECVESVARRSTDSKPQIFRTNFVNAELIKLSVNTFVTTKITFANMLTGICQQLPGANVDQVTKALGMDSRIGPKYLKGAVGYGGPCFPRDNIALSKLARSVGADAHIAESTDRANRAQVTRLAELVKRETPAGGTVAVLGLSYKPHTDVVEQSQGVMLAQALADMGFEVFVHDPAAMANARLVLNGSVRYAATLPSCLTPADSVVMVTPWKEFVQMDLSLLARNGKKRTLIDCWRLFDAEQVNAVARYVAVGVGPEPTTAAAADRGLRVA